MSDAENDDALLGGSVDGDYEGEYDEDALLADNIEEENGPEDILELEVDEEVDLDETFQEKDISKINTSVVSTSNDEKHEDEQKERSHRFKNERSTPATKCSQIPDSLDKIVIKEDIIRSKIQNQRREGRNFQNNYQRFPQKNQRNFKERTTVHINPNFKGQVQVGKDARFVLNARKMDNKGYGSMQEVNKNVAFIQPWASASNNVQMPPVGSMVSNNYHHPNNYHQPPQGYGSSSYQTTTPHHIQQNQHHIALQQHFPPMGNNWNDLHYDNIQGGNNNQSRQVIQIPMVSAATPVRQVFAGPELTYNVNQGIPYSGTNQNVPPQYTPNQAPPPPFGNNSMYTNQPPSSFSLSPFQQPPPIVANHYNSNNNPQQQQLLPETNYSQQQFYVSNNTNNQMFQQHQQPFSGGNNHPPRNNFVIHNQHQHQQHRKEFNQIQQQRQQRLLNSSNSNNAGLRNNTNNNNNNNKSTNNGGNKRGGINKFRNGNFNQTKRRIENPNVDQRRKKRSLERENLHEVPIDTQDTTVTTTEEKQELEVDEEYRRRIEEQKQLREKLLREKEERRKQAAMAAAGAGGKPNVGGVFIPPPKTNVVVQQQQQSANNKKQQQQPPVKLVTTTRVNMNNFQQQQQQKSQNVVANPVLSGARKVVAINNNIKVTESSPVSSFLNNRMVLARDDNLPDTSIVVVSNLAAGTTDVKLRKMCNNIGNIEKLQMTPQERQATIQFKSVASAHAFFKKYQRFMLDLSMIQVTLKQVS